MSTTKGNAGGLMGSQDWYYVEKDQAKGPVSAAELRKLLEEKILPEQTLVWSPEKMKDWISASKLDEFKIVANTSNSQARVQTEQEKSTPKVSSTNAGDSDNQHTDTWFKKVAAEFERQSAVAVLTPAQANQPSDLKASQTPPQLEQPIPKPPILPVQPQPQNPEPPQLPPKPPAPPLPAKQFSPSPPIDPQPVQPHWQAQNQPESPALASQPVQQEWRAPGQSSPAIDSQPVQPHWQAPSQPQSAAPPQPVQPQWGSPAAQPQVRAVESEPAQQQWQTPSQQKGTDKNKPPEQQPSKAQSDPANKKAFDKRELIAPLAICIVFTLLGFIWGKIQGTAAAKQDYERVSDTLNLKEQGGRIRSYFNLKPPFDDASIKARFTAVDTANPIFDKSMQFSLLLPRDWKVDKNDRRKLWREDQDLKTLAWFKSDATADGAMLVMAKSNAPKDLKLDDSFERYLWNNGFYVLQLTRENNNRSDAIAKAKVKGTDVLVRLTAIRNGDSIVWLACFAPTDEYSHWADTFTTSALSFGPSK